MLRSHQDLIHLTDNLHPISLYPHYYSLVCRFLGKLGLKPFDKAAKSMRPVMKAGRAKEEKFADFCVRIGIREIKWELESLAVS
jgi:hypothetical protein